MIRIWKTEGTYLPINSRARPTIIHNIFGDIQDGQLAFDDEEQILAVSASGQLKFWSLRGKQGRLIGELSSKAEGGGATITHLHILSGQSRLLVFYGTHGRIVEFDIARQKIVHGRKVAEEFQSASVSANGSVAVCTPEEGIKVYALRDSRNLGRSTLRTMSAVATYAAAPHGGKTVRFCGDDHLSIMCASTQELWVLDIASCIATRLLQAKEGVNYSFVLSPGDVVPTRGKIVLGAASALELWEANNSISKVLPANFQEHNALTP
ncbi:hypothetical protein BV20DRAFT_1052463 [Pilatotrama ljubarskyi]|nr:hypothetical protein BV20DRAFT_1052463 [Pilatotrama ljubarskyi]